MSLIAQNVDWNTLVQKELEISRQFRFLVTLEMLQIRLRFHRTLEIAKSMVQKQVSIARNFFVAKQFTVGEETKLLMVFECRKKFTIRKRMVS